MTLIDVTMPDVGAVALMNAARLIAFSNDAEIEALTRRDRVVMAVSALSRPHACTSLTALDCTGLTQVTTAGDHWLTGCTSLTALDCAGLSQLVTVGHCWLHDCASLTALDCTGLTQLTTVGGYWL